ncbi:Acetyltransferases [Alteromonadaceae bacterium Bs31]|nr:Acetyltransferases [Alteromonadaceae bacterium Bs31]
MTVDHIEIENLRDHPQFVPVLASWHHSEWLKGYAGSTREQRQPDRQHGQDMQEREQALRSHFSVGPVPSTFIALLNNSENGSTERKVIGSVSIVHYKFSHHRMPSEWLTNLYVLEEYRQQGIGQQLLDYISEFAADNQILHLKLYTKDKEAYYRKRDWIFSHKGLVQGGSVSVLEKWFSV